MLKARSLAPHSSFFHDAPLGRFALLSLTLISLMAFTAACSSAQFVRNEDSKKHHALPLGTKVTVVQTTESLPQPIEILGTLSVTTQGEPANQAKAEETLSKFAARYGCDAISGLSNKRREKKTSRKRRSLGQDGRPVYKKVVTLTISFDWTAQCIRTAKAPADPIRKSYRRNSRRSYTASSRKTSKTAKVEPAPTKTKAAPAKTEPAPTKTEPAPTKTEPAPAKTEAAPKPTPETTPAAPATPDTGDPKVSAEIARAFMGVSSMFAHANYMGLCGALDKNKVVFNIHTKDPSIRIKSELTGEQACASFKSGELAGYLRDFGPAEVHADVATLVPTLFGIRGAAYMQLPTELERSYADQLAERRKGKKPLACYAYFVRQAENLFVISLSCQGVSKYRVLMRRDGPSVFKILNYTHIL